MKKTIIVTGGSSGLGFAMAKRFVQDGANVVITGRNKEKLDEAKIELNRIGNHVLSVQMDVRNPEDAARMVQESSAAFGRIDHLVNNAGASFPVNTEDLTINGWLAIINIMLNGTFFCTHAVGKEWIKNGQQGTILNNIATYAWGAAPGIVHSASAKAGVLAMTRTLAVEWGSKYGIRVNAIAPGSIEQTGGSDVFLKDLKMDDALESVPLKRLGKPEEIAAVAAFLLSDGASYINGECITIDGGQSFNTKAYDFTIK